ncbi:ATP-dependent helicase [Pseudomonas sp. 58 R 3]|uniref:UvrD-helicase domain-containing protein n=1 Tax=Pseudomonas sp. 58 R 3 TaxID=1844108 RepID=UPI00081218D3|nr:ATP-dependent helicase [Pseudomonas sp. 58 R 3]CRM66725.1 ATP-dependent DNA helicase PcrA [Pseudomonas sp. 58 R 3]
MINYTEEQIEAIKPQGSLVITACPGSGKTAVIAEKIRNELAELKSYQGIIAITFTRKASKELEGRCRVNGADTKCSFFGTIDSFCLSEIIYPFLNQIFDGNTVDLEPKYESDLTLAETSIATQLNDIDKVETEELELIRKLYLSDTIYFPTIPALAMYIHENCAACRTYIKAKYTSIYIDEYQDSSKAQHNLFLSIVDSGLIGIAVGDLQQSIYGWRRCSPEYLKELIRRHDFTHRTVSYNHRCHASISNYSNRLFNPQFELTPTDSIQVWQCQFTGTQRDAASHLNTIIPSILDKNKTIKASDIAVLVRNNRSLGYLRDHLTIPCRIFADDPIDELQSRTGFLWSALLKYRFDTSTNPDQIIEILPEHSNTSKAKLIDIRRTIRKARSVDQRFLESYLASTSKKLLNIEPKDSELAALKLVASDIDSLKQYTTTTTNEIQCMTIHKAKGLEFEIVIHLDLNEWLFPYRVMGESFSDKLYPSWEQDLNLHFVGVTRAKTMCLLVHTTQRLNAKDETKSGEPSAFLRLPGVQTLYKTYSSPK